MAVESWVWGVILSLLGCTLSNTGVNLQKLCHMKLAPLIEAKAPVKPMYLQPLWVWGLVGIAVGSVMDLVSFAFASLSLLAPLGAMTLVVNMLMAPFLLQEKLTKLDMTATAVIFFGTVVSIIFGSKDSAELTINELSWMYLRAPFLCYAALLIGSVYYTFRKLKEFKAKKAANPGSLTNVETVFLSAAYPALAGTFGAQSVLFAKSCAEVVRTTAKGENQLVYIQTYVMLVGLGTCIYFQLKLLNAGLAHADALLVVPIYQVFWVLLNILCGMIYFQDYHDMSYSQLFMFSLGAVITMVGIYILTRRASLPDGGKELPGAAATLDVDATALKPGGSEGVTKTSVVPTVPTGRPRGPSLDLPLGFVSISFTSPILSNKARSSKESDSVTILGDQQDEIDDGLLTTDSASMVAAVAEVDAAEIMHPRPAPKAAEAAVTVRPTPKAGDGAKGPEAVAPVVQPTVGQQQQEVVVPVDPNVSVHVEEAEPGIV